MAISVVQTATGTGNPPFTFGANVTVGNTVILVVPGYSTTGAAPSTGSVQLGGNTITGTVAFFNPGSNHGVNSTSGSGNVAYVCIWMLPNIQVSGQTAVDITFTAGNSGIGGVAWEVAGLGTAPSLDQSSSGSSQSASTDDSGTTSAITAAPEIIVGGSMIFSGSGASSPSGFTVSNPTGDCWAGYQIATSSGGTYHWTQTSASTPWAAAIVTIQGTPIILPPLAQPVSAPYRPPPPPRRPPTQLITALPPAAPAFLAEVVQQQGMPYLPPWQITPQAISNPGVPISPVAGLASHAGAALAPSIAITVNAGLASGAGAALNPSVTTSAGTNANAGLATGTGAALAPSVAITVNAGLATGMGVPGAPAISTVTGAFAGLATAAGAAQAPSLAIVTTASAATASAAALSPGGGSGIRNATSAPTVTDPATSAPSVSDG